MLGIRFGTTKDTVQLVSDTFNLEWEEAWLDDSLVQEMILDVDKSEVKSPNCIVSPVLGQIAPTMISGGVKALILMLKTDYEIWATACGDNCAKWILEIAKRKDITISLTHFMKFPIDEFDIFDVRHNRQYHSFMDFIVDNWDNREDYYYDKDM